MTRYRFCRHYTTGRPRHTYTPGDPAPDHGELLDFLIAAGIVTPDYDTTGDRPDPPTADPTGDELDELDTATPDLPPLPYKVAPINRWREAADARGIETKGLTKQQIIAALTRED